MTEPSEFEDTRKSAQRREPRGRLSKPGYQRQRNENKRRRSASSVSSYDDSLRDRRQPSQFKDDYRNIRRRRSSTSPDDRGRDRHVRKNDEDHRERNQSFSRDKSMIARNRNSIFLDQDAELRIYRNGGAGDGDRREHASQLNVTSTKKENNIFPSAAKTPGKSVGNDDASRRPQQPRERSLSPYSRRLALTRSMASMSRDFK